jgi:hypothetical protein
MHPQSAVGWFGPVSRAYSREAQRGYVRGDGSMAENMGDTSINITREGMWAYVFQRK